MQIHNIMPNTNQTTPNFKAIKSVKCEGLYEDFPRYGIQLVETFKKNPVAIQFCKKYDVNLVFYACKDVMNSVRSSLLLFFENPAKIKILGFLVSKKDKIELSGYANSCDINSSLKASTDQLTDYMLYSTEGKPMSGVLNSYIKLKEEEIANKLFKKELSARTKMEITGDDLPKAWLKEDLNDSINFSACSALCSLRII